MPEVKIILDSDPQFLYVENENKVRIGLHKGMYESNTVNKIINLCETNDITAVITAGDLTDHGYDNKNSCLCCRPNGEHDETSGFIEQYYKPIKNINNNLLLCAGNHDTYTTFPYRKPIFNFIKREYGDLYYSKIINGVLFCCCHIYPTRDIRNWLDNQLKQNDKPTVIFFHYNLTGEYSDWFPENDKNEFLTVINKYKNNIMCILTGHWHTSNQSNWNGFKTFIASSFETGLITLNTDTKECSIQFI